MRLSAARAGGAAPTRRSAGRRMQPPTRDERNGRTTRSTGARGSARKWSTSGWRLSARAATPPVAAARTAARSGSPGPAAGLPGLTIRGASAVMPDAVSTRTSYRPGGPAVTSPSKTPKRAVGQSLTCCCVPRWSITRASIAGTEVDVAVVTCSVARAAARSRTREPGTATPGTSVSSSGRGARAAAVASRDRQNASNVPSSSAR